MLGRCPMLPVGESIRNGIFECSIAPEKEPVTAPEQLPAIDLLGARLNWVTERQCVDVVVHEIARGRGGTVFTMNLEHLRRLKRDRTYSRRYREATIVTADGMPLVWASRLQGTPLPERVTGSSLIWTLTAAAARNQRSVYFLGGSPGAAQKAAKVLSDHYPGLRVAGVSSGPSDFQDRADELTAIRTQLADANPDIVYVALGCPKEEQLIVRLRDTLPACWLLGVGISFSFVSGDIPRAPLWMQRSGLEWLDRLAHEPKRLFRRYVVHGLPFVGLLLSTVIFRRFTHPQRRAQYRPVVRQN
jgi:N-acetylglucosaminyldiphosphoundecaprenol N-acetyl-beta-D-mannosaminyltransferase